MPLVPYSLEIVRDTLRQIDRDKNRLGRVICLAHPDIIASAVQLTDLFGPVISKRLRWYSVEQSRPIINWHKAHSLIDRIASTPSLFAALGYQFSAVDITEGRGGEIIHNLNELLPTEHHQRFDFCFDCISNQCFRPGTAVASAALALRIGGYVLHVIPVTAVNQGFYGVSPTFWHDFYESNGFDVISRKTIVGIYQHRGEIELPPVNRVREVPDDAMSVVLARKREHCDPPHWPVMTKFKRAPKCHRDDPPGPADRQP